MVPHTSMPASSEVDISINRHNSIETALEPNEAAVQWPRSGRRISFKVPYAALGHLIAAFDAITIMLASVVGAGVYQLAANGTPDHIEPVMGAGPVAALLYVLIGHATGRYDLRLILAKRRRDAGRILAQWALVGLMLTALAFLMKSGAVYSRGSVVCFGVLTPMLLLAGRGISRRFVRAVVTDGQVIGRRAVLLGMNEELASLSLEEMLEKYGVTEIERVVFPAGKGGFAMTGGESDALDHAIEAARIHGAEEIVLAFPWNDTRKVELVRDGLRVSPLPVRLLPDRRIRSLAGNPAFTLRKALSVEIQRGPLSRTEQVSKRLMDIIGASLGLILLAPLMVCSAIMIKMDSAGPIFFRQRRNGFNAKQFHIYKFRSMSVMEDGATVVQAKRLDPRVTRVGRLLRRTSIDEVPQLINVLLGDMSLVGPRPHALAHDTHYGRLLSDYAFRHHVKPGITGWAQVKGFRGETVKVEQMKGRIDCDLWYINHWSLVLDLKILLMTCLEVTTRKNAY